MSFVGDVEGERQLNCSEQKKCRGTSDCILLLGVDGLNGINYYTTITITNISLANCETEA